MFEKEAEEIVKRNVCGDCNKCQSHGYIGCEVYRYSRDSYLRGVNDRYNNANEWHYVKDGDLPKDNNEKLCFYRKGTVVARYDSEYGCWETYFNNLETVIPSCVIIAWKEIVPPVIKEIG